MSNDDTQRFEPFFPEEPPTARTPRPRRPNGGGTLGRVVLAVLALLLLIAIVVLAWQAGRISGLQAEGTAAAATAASLQLAQTMTVFAGEVVATEQALFATSQTQQASAVQATDAAERAASENEAPAATDVPATSMPATPTTSTTVTPMPTATASATTTATAVIAYDGPVDVTLQECRGDEGTVAFADFPAQSLHAFETLSYRLLPGQHRLRIWWLQSSDLNVDTYLDVPNYSTVIALGDHCR